MKGVVERVAESLKSGIANINVLTRMSVPSKSSIPSKKSCLALAVMDPMYLYGSVPGKQHQML